MSKVMSKERRKELRENRLQWTPNDYEEALNSLDTYEKAIKDALSWIDCSPDEEVPDMRYLQKALTALTSVSE